MSEAFPFSRGTLLLDYLEEKGIRSGLVECVCGKGPGCVLVFMNDTGTGLTREQINQWGVTYVKKNDVDEFIQRNEYLKEWDDDFNR